MATQINNYQLAKLIDANKVLGGAIDISGSADTMGSGLADGDFFLVQDASSGVPQKITAAVMQDYFSKVDIVETASTDAAFQIVFADDDTVGGGDGALRVDGAHLTYNPSSNLLTVAGNISAGDDLLLASDSAVLSLGVDADVTLTHNGTTGAAIASAGAFDIDAAGALTLDGASITIGGDSDVAVDFDSSTFDLDASAAITIDGADDSNFTVTAAGKDLDVAVAGGGAQELRLASAGTGASALHLNASAGGMNVDVADMLDIDVVDEITIDTTSADGHIALTSAHTAGQAILISANAHAGSILDVDAGVMDVDVQGAYSLDASGVSIDSDAASNLTTSAGDLDISSAAELDLDGATVKLDSAGQMDITAVAALNLASAAYDVNASGVVGIDSDAAMTLGGSTIAATADGGALSLTTTDDAGDISLVSGHVAGVAIHLDGNANDASIVDIDAGILDIDAAGAATIDAGGAMTLTAAGVALAGGSSEIDITTTGALDLNGAAVTVDATAGLSLDAATASNFTTAAGALTLDGAGGVSVAGNASEVDITTSGALDLNSGAMTLDASTISLDGSGALNIDTSDTSSGIALGTATSGVPIAIGHGTSEVSIGQNLTVAGNLTINGATTTVSTNNMVVEDKFIELGNGVSGTPSGDAGFVIERGSSSNVALIWDESEDEFVLGAGSVTGASTGNLSLTPSDLQVGSFRATKLEIDGASNSIDVDTDLKVVAAADIVLDPGGNNVVPGSDSVDSLGRGATSASHSAGSANSALHTNLRATDGNFSMTAVQNQVIFYGNTLVPGSASAVSAISSSNLGSISLSAFNFDTSGTLTITGSPSVSISAGTVISVDNSSASAFFVVVEDYSGGTTMKVSFIPSGLLSSQTTSVSSPTGMSTYGSPSVTSGYAGSSITANGTMKFNQNGSANTAIFVAKTGISQFGFNVLVVVDPRDDLSSGISSFPGSTTYGGSSQTSGGSVTAAVAAVAWANLHTDAITLGGTAIAATATELNIMDGGTSATSTTLADADRFVVNDGGTMKQVALTDLEVYMEANLDTMGSQFTSAASLATVGALDAGSITSNFGSINVGSSTIGTSGAITGGSLIGSSSTMVIGASGDSDALTMGAQSAAFASDVDVNIAKASGLQLGGVAVSSTAAELNLLDGVSGLVQADFTKLAAVDSTAAELNIVDGGTSATSTTVATGDRVVYNDDGTMVQVSVDNLGTYFGSGAGVQASSAGVLSVDYIEDLFMKIGSGTLLTNGLSASLSQEPLADSLHVYLNGLLMLRSGSITGNTSFDYRVDGSGASQKVVFPADKVTLDNDDVVTLKYIKN